MECQGSAHPARLICLWGAVVVTLGADASPEPPPYDALPRYSRQILDEALGPADSLAEGGGNEAFQAASVRSWSYIAPGLLLRNHGEDRERACRILRWVLGHQFTDPAAPEYGVWKNVAEGNEDRSELARVCRVRSHRGARLLPRQASRRPGIRH